MKFRTSFFLQDARDKIIEIKVVLDLDDDTDENYIKIY